MTTQQAIKMFMGEKVDNFFALLTNTGGSFDPAITYAGPGIPQWDLGDTNTQTGTAFTHVYAGGGPFDVQLSVADKSQLTHIITPSDNVTDLTPPADLIGLQQVQAPNNALTDFNGETLWPLVLLYINNNSLTSLTLQDWAPLQFLRVYLNPALGNYTTYSWPAIRQIRSQGVGMTSFATFAWPALQRLFLFDNSLAALTTQAWPSLENLQLQNNALTSLATFNTWTNMTRFNAANNVGITSITTHPEWTSLQFFEMQSCALTSFTTHPEWVAIEDLRFNDNLLNAFVAHPEWVALDCLDLTNNNITSFITHPEWINLRLLTLTTNNLTSLTTHTEWVALEELVASDNNIAPNVQTFNTWTSLTRIQLNNNALTTFQAHREWTLINEVKIQNNMLPATEIDAVLIELDASGALGGTLDYAGNPGAPDVSRSAPAATAKANLIGNGWTVLI